LNRWTRTEPLAINYRTMCVVGEIVELTCIKPCLRVGRDGPESISVSTNTPECQPYECASVCVCVCVCVCAWEYTCPMLYCFYASVHVCVCVYVREGVCVCIHLRLRV